MNKSKDSFFSVSFDLIMLDREISYDLYVNASSKEEKEKFVRLFPKGDLFKREYVEEYRKKYFQLYVLESQRHEYLNSLIKSNFVVREKKTEIIKDSAIRHLQSVFSDKKKFNTEYLSETIVACRENVEHLVDVVENQNVRELQDLIGKLSFHDFYTYDHSVNVSMYCISILRSLRPHLPRQELLTIGLGGLLHDLGKMFIPTEIINSTGKLTDDEFAIIKNHPKAGLDLLANYSEKTSGVDLEIIKHMIVEHHENMDGSGYPNKLKGNQIHLYARICAVADFFDAITTKRSYAPVLSMEDAVNVMSKAVGKKIDPTIFDIFLNSLQKVLLKGKVELELDESFEPSIPYINLPFKKLEVKKTPLK